jgi:hypothetical protein
MGFEHNGLNQLIGSSVVGRARDRDWGLISVERNVSAPLDREERHGTSRVWLCHAALLHSNLVLNNQPLWAKFNKNKTMKVRLTREGSCQHDTHRLRFRLPLKAAVMASLTQFTATFKG